MFCSQLKYAIICLIALSFYPVVLQSQEIKSGQSAQIQVSISQEFQPAAVSPDGKKLLLTTPDYQGIWLYDIEEGKTTRVTGETGSGYEPVFSGDGSKIWFRSASIKGMLKYSSINEYDISSGQSMVVEPLTRSLSTPSVVSGKLVYFSEGRVKGGSLISKGGAEEVFVTNENLVPVIYKNGVRNEIRPMGEGYYIWVSLSPDRSKMLFNFQGTRTYISDLNGKILFDAGRINAPKWLTDEYIIGMDDRDDGHRVLESDIVSYSLKTGRTVKLTETADKIEMYPLPLPGGNKVAFSTMEGKIYLLEIKYR